ncbi:MAG TPA: glycosyltransferase [Gammaproteobacteria bacterium]|nr:glycosyltransferase [Gammaproteobacteria bacterium]
MRVLLSTIGSRGDVQPLIALALQLKALGHHVHLCAPPDFREWVQTFEIPFFPIGPEVRAMARASRAPASAPPPSREQVRQMMAGTVATQFATIPAAARDCDAIVGANALQVAAPSIAERMGIPYVFATYCPVTLPSHEYAPPAVTAWKPANPAASNDELWAEDAARWTESWGPALNTERAARGLPPVADVRSHVLTQRPWLAADPVLAPWPPSSTLDVLQTGAWPLPDERPLGAELEAFLAAGAPPIYFGFGSSRAPQDASRAMIASARALKRRAIVQRGWAELALPDDGADCLSVGEVNQQALFERVAAVVHHGGAGTTTAATRAGVPQVVIPQHYDQPYFARRVAELGIGVAHAQGAPTVESLAAALDAALAADVAVKARATAERVRTDGARFAAQRLVELVR